MFKYPNYKVLPPLFVLFWGEHIIVRGPSANFVIAPATIWLQLDATKHTVHEAVQKKNTL